MAAAGLGLFLLEAAAGTAVLLLFFPTRTLGKGFFALHGALVSVFLALAISVRPAQLSLAVLVGAALLAGLQSVAAWAGLSRSSRVLLGAAAAASVFSLVRLVLVTLPGRAGAWVIGGAALGGILFGSALLTMNLGHWYLVSRSLPFRLLKTGAVFFAAAAGARTLFLAAALAADSSNTGVWALFSLEREGLFFLFRVLWGIAGPLALSYFVWKTADMRANQAATGLLYVAVLFVLIGELLSSYLTMATGFPA